MINLNYWTTKEISYLKKYAILAETNEVLNIPEMAKKLNRTIHSVKTKIYKMQKEGGLPEVDRSRAFEAAGRPWTKSEDKRLIQMKKKGAKIAEIAEVLDRTKVAINGRINKLIAAGKLKNTQQKWSESEIQLLLDTVEFDANGYVSNYPKLCSLIGRNYIPICNKISNLRKEGRINQQIDKTKTSVKAKESMTRFNDARFAQYRKKEEEPMIQKEQPLKPVQVVSVESKEVTLILTTTIIDGQRSEQYFTKEGQLLIKKSLHRLQTK